MCGTETLRLHMPRGRYLRQEYVRTTSTALSTSVEELLVAEFTRCSCSVGCREGKAARRCRWLMMMMIGMHLKAS